MTHWWTGKELAAAAERLVPGSVSKTTETACVLHAEHAVETFRALRDRPPTTFPVSQSTPNAALLLGSLIASTRRVGPDSQQVSASVLCTAGNVHLAQRSPELAANPFSAGFGPSRATVASHCSRAGWGGGTHAGAQTRRHACPHEDSSARARVLSPL